MTDKELLDAFIQRVTHAAGRKVKSVKLDWTKEIESDYGSTRFYTIKPTFEITFED